VKSNPASLVRFVAGTSILALLTTTVIDGAILQQNREGCYNLKSIQSQDECINALSQKRSQDFLPAFLATWFIVSIGAVAFLNSRKS
jgi:hypothetical protein